MGFSEMFSFPNDGGWTAVTVWNPLRFRGLLLTTHMQRGLLDLVGLRSVEKCFAQVVNGFIGAGGVVYGAVSQA